MESLQLGRGLSPRQWAPRTGITLMCLAVVAVPIAGKGATDGSKCETCRSIATTFKEKYAETDTIHFRGESKGWSLDNEKFLGRYKMGEARLAEIMEGLCRASDAKCNALMEDLEEPLEEWWAAKDRNQKGGDISGLEDELCIVAAKVCCQPGKWGPKCAGCPRRKGNGTGAVCSGHGACNGDGYRGGTGKCRCDGGWAGKRCDRCKKGHYAAGSTECKSCDKACKNCTGPAATDCLACAKGFAESSTADDVLECVDVDECAVTDGGPLCSGPKEFCRNTPGSFSCDACHAECGAPVDGTTAVCSGPGPENCTVCPEGYETVVGGGCHDVDECAADGVCESGQYCHNLPGSHQCLRCNAACSDKGCSGAGDDHCVECNEGYRLAEAAGGEGADRCVDVDECAGFECAGAADCTNTPGGFSCKCAAPNLEDADTGECARPAGVPAVRAPSGFPDDAVATAVALFGRLVNESADPTAVVEHRTEEVGPHSGNLKLLTVAFKEERFEAPPDVTYIRATNECCGDQFGFDAVNVTEAGFVLAVWRTDTQGGWGQPLKVEWAAVLRGAGPGAAPAATGPNEEL